MLELRRADALRKQEQLHREWTEQVFAPIQAQIDATISHRVATSDLGERWRRSQDEYLAACAPQVRRGRTAGCALLHRPLSSVEAGIVP